MTHHASATSTAEAASAMRTKTQGMSWYHGRAAAASRGVHWMMERPLRTIHTCLVPWEQVQMLLRQNEWREASPL